MGLSSAEKLDTGLSVWEASAQNDEERNGMDVVA